MSIKGVKIHFAKLHSDVTDYKMWIVTKRQPGVKLDS